MPHVNIKHFPASLDEQRAAALVAALTRAVKDAFAVDEGVISIALEPVAPEAWDEEVRRPEIVGRRDLLLKAPSA